jgi:hypothetical protein
MGSTFLLGGGTGNPCFPIALWLRVLIVKMTALKKYRPYRANAAEQRAGGALTEAAKPK